MTTRGGEGPENLNRGFFFLMVNIGCIHDNEGSGAKEFELWDMILIKIYTGRVYDNAGRGGQKLEWWVHVFAQGKYWTSP